MAVVAVRLSKNDTVVPTVELVMATVAADTVPVNTVPPELVIVTTPISLAPTASATATAPVVLIVRLDVVPPAVPVTKSKLMALLVPVPTVSVAPSASVASPMSMSPVAVPPILALAVTATAVPESPKEIVLEPVLAAMVPAILSALGARAATPAVNVVESVESFPIVRVPVLEKVVVPAMEFEAPVIDTL